MATSNYYVDPAGGNDTTGNGTIGTPWATVQKALNTITRNATDGDQINVKAGGTDTLGAMLTLATYGTPAAAAPLLIRGYTSAANDGGIGIIDGAGSYAIWLSASEGYKSYVNFMDMKLGNCGSAAILGLGSGSVALHCELHTSTATQAVKFSNAYSTVIDCYIHDLSGASNIYVENNGCSLLNNNIKSAGGTYVIDAYGNGTTILGNIVDIATDTSLVAIYARQEGNRTIGNTIYSAAAETVAAIQDAGSNSIILDNVIVGYSGTGGIGLHKSSGAILVVGANAYYNCATNETNSGKITYTLKAAVSLAATPYTDAPNDDFSIAAGSTALEAAWPVNIHSLSTTTNKQDIGAVQKGAGAGGGLLTHPGMTGGMNG